MKKKPSASFLEGIGSVMNIFGSREFSRPGARSFRKDRQKIKADVSIFSNELYTVTSNKYGKIAPRKTK